MRIKLLGITSEWRNEKWKIWSQRPADCRMPSPGSMKQLKDGHKNLSYKSLTRWVSIYIYIYAADTRSETAKT